LTSTLARYENLSKSASRVDLDHFDPEGVRELSQSLAQSLSRLRVTGVRSDTPNEPFLLEKDLRASLDKYAHFTSCGLSDLRQLIVQYNIDRQ
jgi:hypothetical protein